MTEEQMITWIDHAAYEQLLYKWRFARVGDPFFSGEVGRHYASVMEAKRREVGNEEHIRASKTIGWDS
jgi:hypothetical protein